MSREPLFKRFDMTFETSSEDVSQIYVPRPNRPMRQIRAYLERPSGQYKFLLTGQAGCGKTTELRKLAWDLVDEYFVIYCTASRIPVLGNPIEVEFMYLVMHAIMAAVYRSLPELAETLKRQMPLLTGNFSLGSSDHGVLDMSSSASPARGPSKDRELNAGSTAKRPPRVSDLQQIVSAALSHVQKHAGKGVLLMIDDLERLEYDRSRILLKEHAHLLTSLPCAAVYTASLSLLFDSDVLPAVRDKFTVVDLSNVPIVDRHDDIIDVSLVFFREVFARRTGMTSSSIGESLPLEVIFRTSGGNLRQCFRLLTSAYLYTTRDWAAVPTAEAARRSIRDAETDYSRLLSGNDAAAAESVLVDKQFRHGMPFRLLSSLAVLEYWDPECGLWYDVNPLVYSLLGRKSMACLLSTE